MSEKHECTAFYEGSLVATCSEDESGHYSFYVDGNEWGFRVDHCPICGSKAPQPVFVEAA